MIYTTSRIWQMEQQKKKDSSFDYGIAILPVGRKRCYQFAGTNLAIFETKNKARKEAAWKFVKFLCSKESTIYWSCNTGYLPVRTSAINSEEYRNYISAHPDYQVGVEAVKYAKIQPKVTAWESVRGILDDAMYNALSQRETPRQALDDAAKKANMLLINDIVDNH
jgi:ABC-type glycerol-3-phosphate transport system substrate-binding protein